MKRSSLPSCMHVHFLPETMKGSIKIPRAFQKTFYNYFLRMYRSADELIVFNPIFIEPLSQYNIPKERITYIPNVVSSRELKPVAKSTLTHVYEKYDIDPNTFTVLSVGQVQTRKGVLDFVEIAKAMPETQFIWAGGSASA